MYEDEELPEIKKMHAPDESNAVKLLMGEGWSKYKIAKEIRTSWNTVHAWALGRYKPNKKFARKLKLLTDRYTY